ncbi:Myb-like DNA-binding domain containing protein [Trichomonas vaginalis G3]|uniref:Myb-like DNA-binding domain containing protein n=1 Tax=Trichomonas vaginalis (strain ATCC PRA-98 / G3) TaxID=412133 RepID=A2E044_TRIV3|nr:glycolytic process regulation protein [Trichomonas vaginalis G3]EAY13963.1 Myb-like DNA-binding domain containing protein [Trichomonas vaginalis G3]KAI5551781.1 glycolytic process regulation protein [Trichomonas vaginalis G3]|eukprot:XP_001326186.1 Myb-like DNA-binding domain containing protein [Trichomonas vaginalis G3]
MRPGNSNYSDGPKRVAPPLNRPYQQIHRSPKDNYKSYRKEHSWKAITPAKKNSIPAAPYPSLPTKGQVLDEKNKIDSQIIEYQIDLSTLRQAPQTVGVVSHVESQPDSLGVVDVGGFIANMNLVDSVIAQNKNNAKLAAKEASVDANQRMMFSSHAPYAVQDLREHEDLLPLLFTSVFYTKMIEKEKEEALAEQYDTMRGIWNTQCDAVDTIAENPVFPWPEDMPESMTKTADDKVYMEFVADDTPMIINPAEKDVFKFNTDARLVNDPVSEHHVYKQRVKWSEEEKNIFLEQWCSHPKDFVKIASFLPDKSVKEVIEFYYLNKNLYDMKNLQAASKKRAGGRKKVASEGAIHK